MAYEVQCRLTGPDGDSWENNWTEIAEGASEPAPVTFATFGAAMRELADHVTTMIAEGMADEDEWENYRIVPTVPEGLGLNKLPLPDLRYHSEFRRGYAVAIDDVRAMLAAAPVAREGETSPDLQAIIDKNEQEYAQRLLGNAYQPPQKGGE